MNSSELNMLIKKHAHKIPGTDIPLPFYFYDVGGGKGGGGGGDPPSSTIADTETRQYARETLYPMVTGGLKGEGYGTPEFNALRSSSLTTGLDKAYGTAKTELESTMARTLEPEDTRVSNYLTNSLQRQYVTKKDDINRTIRSEKVSDIDISQGLAADYLASEKRMTVSGAQMYNQALQQNVANQQQLGTFSSNLASGVGAGAAGLYGAQQIDSLYANKMGR